jgi:hypothetical protein
MFDSDWGGAVAWQKIEGQGMWGPWVMNIPERLYEIAASGKKNYVGDGECVAIAQFPLKMSHTSFWRPGVKVLGNGDEKYFNGVKVSGSGIVRGTVIATFIDKRYPSKVHGNHVAIYLSQTKDSIDVIDQWNIKDSKGNIIGRQPPHNRTISIGGNGLSNDADAFSIVFTLP